MSRSTPILPCALIVVFLSLGAAIRPEPPMPTLDDLNAMYDAKQYRTCLQQIARLMHGASQGGNDKYTLLLLRGDCLLQLRDGASAKGAYAGAAKSPDIDQAAEAHAMMFLISNSPGLQYTPSGGGEPISILDRADRKRAMLALFNDQLESSGNEFRRALNAQNMDPILKVLPKLRSLYGLELTATGKTDRIASLFADVGQSARDVLGQQLSLMNQKIQQIEAQSTQPGGATVITQGGAWWTDPGIVRMGLTPEARQTLRDIIDYCPNLIENAEHGLRVAQRVGGKPELWQELIDGAQQTQLQASSILNAE